jgi:glycosyltransferase involved in cell wall biosynthesis
LLEDGAQVVILAPVDDCVPKLQTAGCEFRPLVIDSKGTSPWQDFKLFHQYLRIYREVKPDAALHYTIKPVIYGTNAARACGVPVINTITGLGTGFLHGGWMTRVVEFLYRRTLKRSGRVFFQNGDDRSLFLERGLVDRGLTDLVPGSGVDLERFRAGEKEEEKEDIVFLLVARLLRDKGIGEFVDAARRIKASGARARFQLLGALGVENRSAILREEVDAWVAEGCIEYLGVTDDVRPFVQSADCVVLPSYREGTPRTLLEAAAMGKPLIATDVPGCREVVVDGENGLLCEVKDSRSLEGAMLRFVAMPSADQRAMGMAGRLLVEARFDERLVVERYMQEINRLVG